MEMQDSKLVVEGAPSSIDWYLFSLENLGYQSRYSIRLKGASCFFLESEDFAASLSINLNDSRQSMSFHGDLLRLEQKFIDEGHSEIELQLGCSLHQLENFSHERVFYQTNAIEIIKSLLADSGIQAVFNCKQQYLAKSYIAQGGVSDYDFLQRLCSESGIYFYYRMEREQACLYFVDDKPEGTNHQLLMAPFAGLHNNQPAINAFREQQFILPEGVTLRGCNELNSQDIWEAKEQSRSEILGKARIELFDYQSFQSEQELCTKAHILQQQLDWQRQLYFIESTYAELQPADMLNIENLTACEKQYYQVLEVNISFQLREEGRSTLSSSLWLLPSSIAFKALCPETQCRSLVDGKNLPLALRDQYQKPLPVFKMAIIVGQDKNKVELDDYGRYQIRLLFEEHPAKEQWHYARLIQPAAGQGKSRSSGMHFPLKPGTRVVIGHLDGCIDKPIILGCLPDNDQPSPVYNNNRDCLLFQNAQGAGFEWQEQQTDRQSLSFHTEKAAHGLEMSIDKQQEAVRISSLDEIYLNTEKNLNAVQQQFQAVSKSYQLKAADEFSLVSEQSMQLRSGENIKINAGESWQLSSEEGMMQYQAKDKMQYKGQSIYFSASSLRASARKADIFAGQSLDVYARQGGLLLCENSAIHLTENSIIFSSDKLTIEAAEVKKHQGGRINELTQHNSP